MRGLESTNVWVRCPECGRDRYDPADLTLRVCLDDEGCAVTWRCRRCGRASATAVTSLADVGALVAAGTPVVHWRLPGELAEAARPREPFTIDELEALLARLDTDGFVEQALADAQGLPEDDGT